MKTLPPPDCVNGRCVQPAVPIADLDAVMPPLTINVKVVPKSQPSGSDAPYEPYSLEIEEDMHRILRLGSGLMRIVWTLDKSALDGPLQELTHFDTTGITFFGENAPYISIPGANSRDEWSIIWANTRAIHQRSYAYRIRVVVGNTPVSHDPTIENQPPLLP
ncbi:MAG: hypothetical protein M3Q69_20875 [Acidobacteriota bacterium]|nr:hypothetical protein [Acidobacteriota bacterium]